MCKDYNDFASTKYNAGVFGIGKTEGALKKGDIFDYFVNKPVMGGEGGTLSVCDSKDEKFGFICFKDAKKPNDSTRDKRITDEEYGEMQDLVVKVL